MSWTGRSSLVLMLAVVAVAVTAMLPGVAQADRQGDLPLFYPSFPDAGGPYITCATYHAGDAEVRVVFNEPVDPATVALDDFTLEGFTATTVAMDATNRMAILTGLADVDPGTDLLYLSDIGVVEGADGYASHDLGHVVVGEGPVIVYAELFNWVTDDPDDDSLAVYFDDAVGLVTADPFGGTPELAGAELAHSVGANVIGVDLDGAATTHLRQMWPGISKVWLEQGGVEWSDNAVGNSMAHKRMVENGAGGPILLGAYYDNVADDIWLVFSEAVNPASILPSDPAVQYDLGFGSSFGGAATQDLAFPGEFTNAIKIHDTGLFLGTAEIRVDAANLLTDYQDEAGPQTDFRPITTGFGILRSEYDDGGTEDLLDDRLDVWFCEEFDSLAAVDGSDFHFTNLTDSVFVYLTLQATNESGLGHVSFTDWQVADDSLAALAGRLPIGHTIYVDAASDLVGASSRAGVDSDAQIPIWEGYHPESGLSDVPDPDWTYKYYDAGPPVVDLAYMAWNETQVRESGMPDNSDQYFLFSTWTDQSAFDSAFIEAYAQNAIPVGNIGNGLLDETLGRLGISIESGVFETSDGHVVADEDRIWFMLVPATYWGGMGEIGDALIMSTSFLVGPVCPARDSDLVDDDLIHVAASFDADSLDVIRRVWGDASSEGGAAPCGDVLFVMDGPDPMASNELGQGPINADGSFGPIYLATDANDLQTLYLFAEEDGAFSEGLAIINDIVSPALLSINGEGQIDVDDDGVADGDLFNPYRIYKAQDYVNILVQLNDRIGDPQVPTNALSDLLECAADFSGVDESAVFGSDSTHQIPLVSMGADQLDNDGDWDDTAPGGTAGNGVMDFPEPYFDENGDGDFDPGETFVDLDGDDLCDCVGGSGDEYDYFLDSADSDEHGWYEIQLDAAAANDVTKGFQILDPITDDLGLENFAEIFDLPVPLSVTDPDYEATSVFDDEDTPFHCELDEAEPSAAYMTEIYNLASYTAVPNPAENLWSPTDPVYNLGRYTSFKIETPSDYDVLFCVTEIDPGTGSFVQFTLDPGGINADVDAPGVAEFDDDRDEAVEPDGIDQDEDGEDGNEGEGIDYQDAEVVDAMQDEAADTAAPGGDGMYVTTDYRDNDNDAFFVFEPYVDLDAGSPSDVYQRIIWYNIDETTNNGIDDDNDGNVDDAGETETYDPEADDNEDGIVDGEAVSLTADGARMVTAFDDTYAGAFYVDAAHVLGEARDSEVDIRGLTEFVPAAWEVLDPNGVAPFIAGLPWGDSTSSQEYDWHTIHGAENIDLWHIAQLYGIATDGTGVGRFRANAYDQPGNMNSAYSVPFEWTLDTTPPDLSLENCVAGTEEDPSLTGPPDFMAADVDPDEDGIQIYNEGVYTLTTEDDGTAVECVFESRTSVDGGLTWTGWAPMPDSPDGSRPFTSEFDASGITLSNDPPDAYVLVQFRAYGGDEFENWEEADDACVFQIKVIDGEPGVCWFTLIHDVPNALHPPTPPDCDYPVYWYRENYGAVQVPVSPAIAIRADFDDSSADDVDCLAEATNDIIRAVFEIRQAGEGNEWMELATITGEVITDPDTGEPLSVEFTKPVAVTLDTEWLANEYGTGSYDIRVYVCDIEGNCNIMTADIAMLTVVYEGLRAYIQPPVNTGVWQYGLYAINWIHDYEIDYVTFEYFEDLNDNGLDDNDDRLNGSAWHTIAVDDLTSTRGDILLREGSDAIETLGDRTAFTALGGPGGEGFIDYDGDGYSARDPVIRDDTAPFNEYNSTDTIILGDEDDILASGMTALTNFATIEFHTGDAGAFDTNDWIFRENGLQAPGALDLWYTGWDATGLEGSVLVRSVATDEYGAVDDNGGVTIPSVIPTEQLILDTQPPTAVFTQLSYLEDGGVTVVDASEPNIYISGSVGWLKLEASSDDIDLDHLLFEYSTNGGIDWMALDVNDDDDSYADIDDLPGLTAEDEIFLDNGDFVYGAGDILLYAGANGEINTAGGRPLIPLVTEDPGGNGDEDNDGLVDEDDDVVPADADAPYFIYFIWPVLASDTNVLFKVTAEDQSGNVDPTPPELLVIMGESTPPETDVVEVLTADGAEVDVWPRISDGDGVTQLPGGTVSVHVTAEDASAIDYVDLMWRFDPSCYPELEPWENLWHSMSDPLFGYADMDDTYPYNFAVDLSAVSEDYGDLVVAFYPNAVDENGNQTPAPENPYLFRVMTNFAEITTDLSETWVAPGDEFWFTAGLYESLINMHADEMVGFYYAERILLEVIDPSRITPDPIDPTYMTLPLTNAMASNPGNHAVLDIADSTCTYHDDLTVLTDPTMYDWTYDVGGQHIEFGAPPPTDAEILVSYNVTEYAQIGEGDSEWPYTVAWDQDDGGVPYPSNPDTDVYDIIAILSYGDLADDQCGMVEEFTTEWQVLFLVNEDAPEVTLYPFGLHNEMPAPFEPANYEYWPGNPSFDSEGGMTQWKLSGVEHEFFVMATDEMDAVVDVNLIFTQGDSSTTVPMALIDENQDNVFMTFTLYESDFPFVRYEFENVTLNLDTGYSYPMTAGEGGVWQVTGVPVPVGTETTYDFFIDMVGDDFDESVVDPRNWGVLPTLTQPADAYSSVMVPSVPFYFASSAAVDFGAVTAVWRVQATAEDEDGNIGVNGPFTFVYDPEMPTVDEVTATSLRFDADFTVGVYAQVTDPVPPDFNAITVDSVIFQYCPNYYVTDQPGAHVWVDFGNDTDASDGWSATGTIPDPESDGFDNDGDEDWDEADESTSNMAFRALAVDDGHNVGEPTILEFILDETEPVAEVTNPVEGEVYPFGASFDVTADIVESEGDVDYVLFQFNAGDGWMDIDITPEDNSDDPWDAEAPYAVGFNTADYLDEGDAYCSFRAVPTDAATNAGTSNEVLVVINDVTGPTAFIMTATTTGGQSMPLTDPHTAVTGDNVGLGGVAVDPSGAENLATVTVQYALPAAEDWVTIAVVNTFTPINATTVAWELDGWDVTGLPEGGLSLQAIATDIDGNTTEPIVVTLPIDHTAPSTFYEMVAGQFDGFAPFDLFDNDGIAGSQGRALVPDPATEDLAFMVYTPDTDVSGIVLQYRLIDDPLGQWTTWTFTGDAFDFEPNLTFEDGGVTYYVWWLYVDNFADVVALSGDVELRGLASDYAGNANILHNMDAPEANPWETWTIDTDDPFQVDFNNDLTADQVASGDPVTLTCVMSDSTTDVVTCRFEVSDDGGQTWEVVGAPTVTGENIDTPYAQWTAQIVWTAPLVYWDTAFLARAVFYDTAGNEGLSDEMGITVEDTVAPDMTKLYAIAPEVHWVDWFVDGGDGPADGVYMADCENDDHDGLFFDHNENDVFNQGTDLAIDYGMDGLWLWDTAPAAGSLGGPDFAWPRFIDETMLDNQLDLYVSHEVVLIGRTQIHDSGLAMVEFYVVPDGGAGEPILVAVDECPPAYGATYLWHVFWNTLAVDVYGAPIYPDGAYQVVLIGEDREGNREVWDPDGAPTIWVDNTAPEATADADPLTQGIQTTVTIERNGVFQLFATTESEREDDSVEFFVKRARDLNMDESWWAPTEGVDDSDVNPDPTRPYVFDWDLNQIDPPLPVGEEFNMAATGTDFLDNGEFVTDVYDDGRFITMTITDTQGPAPTITEVARTTGDTTPIVLPHLMDAVHARDLDYIEATLLNAEKDCERVEFLFMPEGGTDPTLIDADVYQPPEDPYSWHIHDWDLSALAPGSYLVWARGWDDVGNYADGPQFLLVVDYTPPEYAVVTPYDGMKECPLEWDDGESVFDYYELIFTTVDVDIWDDAIAWEWKPAEDPDDDAYWNAISTDIVFDADSGAYAGIWNMYDMSNGLYDVRLTVYDVAGNVTQMIVAVNVVWENSAPEVHVTRIDVEGEQVYPIHDVVDISVGDLVTLYATAHDDESALPDAPYETGITSMIFEARRTTGADQSWYEIGLWTAPEGTIFTEVTHSIDWNTSGLLGGTYEVRAAADDELCNYGYSGAVVVGVFDIEPPRARICGFQPWRETHGDDPESYVDIYGCAYSDSEIWEVQFQYSTDEGGTWIPIGIARQGDDDGWLPTAECDLWFTTMSLDSLGLGTQFLLRGLAMDTDENQDEDPPTLLVEVIENMYGQLELAAVDDLGIVGAPTIEYQSSDDDCYMIVTVEMTDAAQTPQVLMVSPASEAQYPGSAYQFCVEMVRMVDNPLMWRGIFDMPYGDDEECGRYTVFANALSDGQIDMQMTHQWTWEVTNDLGSNGVMSVPGYLADADPAYYLYASAWIPPGNDMSDYCFLMAPAWAPQLNQDEAQYLTTLERTSYHIGFACDYDYPETGFWGEVTIEYDDAALLAACGGDADLAAEKEAYVTVRRHDAWYDEAWSGEYIQQISVDTDNNKVTFVVTDWDYDETIFALFVPRWNGPIVVRSFTPDSPYDGRWNYTDRDPVIIVDLNGFGNEEEDIEEESIQLWIDGNLVATYDWVQGDADGGDLSIEWKDYDATMVQLIYTHATARHWWLEDGWHTLQVRYQVEDEYDYGWIELPQSAPGARFYVDATPPMVQLYSGWANDPILNQNGYTLDGWLSPDNANEMLTAFMYDEGAGVLVCPTDIGDDPNLQGIKYDLWLVQPDRPDVIDEYYDPIEEIEHRLLLHNGTCTELEPYLDPPLVGDNAYVPGDTLFMPVPIVAGGRHHDIQDGDILEVVFYTMKHVEDNPALHCEVGTITLPGQDGDAPDTLGAIYLDCHVDLDGHLHVYDQGVLDWAGNAGAEFVEARFVVDKTAPTVELITPPNGEVEPGDQFCFEAAISDAGSGVSAEGGSVMLKDAHGQEIALSEVVFTDETVSGCVEDGLPTGGYSLHITVRDRAGNEEVVAVPITVQSAVLGISDAHIYPNPFDPNETDGTIAFHLSRAADVTVKAYDFAGDYVGTLFYGPMGAGAAGSIPWAGQAGDGTALANGAYLIRVEAFDGATRRATTVKAVIWRE